MNRKVSVCGRNFAYETLVLESARKLARHLTAPKTAFNLSYPFTAEDAGYVGSDLKERIASLTLAERKTAGISKTTWHYIQKRAAEGRPLRLYGKVARRLSPVSAQH